MDGQLNRSKKADVKREAYQTYTHSLWAKRESKNTSSCGAHTWVNK